MFQIKYLLFIRHLHIAAVDGGVYRHNAHLDSIRVAVAQFEIIVLVNVQYCHAYNDKSFLAVINAPSALTMMPISHTIPAETVMPSVGM